LISSEDYFYTYGLTSDYSTSL